MAEDKQEMILINEDTIKNKIYVIRGQKVMLDADLAEIYGYTTKAFNQQVKNNMDRFDEDFRFRLTKDEVVSLRSKKLTSNWGGSRYLPYAFNEQGIYMLMTILKGELAVKQSKALIRTFKQMKDYIIANQNLIGEWEYLQLSMQVAENTQTTKEIQSDLFKVENQLAATVERLSDTVTHSELSLIMKQFEEPCVKQGYLILNGQPFRADLAYNEIYSLAQCSIYIVDNYIGIKTLEQLINVAPRVEVRIFSDNLFQGLRKNIFADFCKEYPKAQIKLYRTGGIFHDRYIILDYGTSKEKIYHCGASSKDAGARITSILEDLDREKYRQMIYDLLQNPVLVLK